MDFIKFLNESINVINEHSEKVVLKVSEDIGSLLNKKGQSELKALSNKFLEEERGKKYKPVAEVIIYIPDTRVNIHVAETITNASGDFMEALGFELETEDEPVYSSFLKKLRYVFNKTIGNKDIEKVYDNGKKALN
jgi:hypothetical protein